MSPTTGKILIGLGVPATAFGLYIVRFETGRLYFYVQNLLPGLAVTAVGVTLLAIGIGKVVKPIAGVGAFLLGGGLAALMVYVGVSSQIGREQGYADREALVRSLLPVCEGKARSNAAARSEQAPRKTILIVKPSEGPSYEWGADIDPRWQPSSIEDTQLVACFVTEKRAVDSCTYNDTGGKYATSITSYQYFIIAKMYEARTAKLLGEQLFEGGKPTTGCSDTITVRKGERQASREGAMPSKDDQLAFVRRFVENVERP